MERTPYSIPPEMGETLITERVLTNNGYLLLFCADCPSELADSLVQQTEETGIDWFQASKRNNFVTRSRRPVFFPKVPVAEDTVPIVIKQKVRYGNNTLTKVGYFSQSVIHEMRASYTMMKVIDSFPEKNLEYNGDRYALNVLVQLPYGGIINTHNPSERYGIFKYMSGISVLDEVVEYEGWNTTPEDKRVLFGKLQTWLGNLANYSEQFGLEPFDLGSHQLVYTLKEREKNIDITILDTEEYNYKHFGVYWNDTLREGLPPVLVYKTLF